MRLLLTSFIGTEVVFLGLAQADVIPSDLLSIFFQLPLVGLFAWFMFRILDNKDKQHAQEIELLETRCNRTIDLFEKIIDRQDSRQADLIATLASLEKVLTLNTATVSESIRLSELVDELRKVMGE